MTTPTFVHCLFEQSGTFRDQFRNINIPAEDYDLGIVQPYTQTQIPF